MIENELTQARIQAARQRGQQANSPKQQAQILSLARYEGARPVARDAGGREVPIELMAGGSAPDRFLAIEAGGVVYGLWQ